MYLSNKKKLIALVLAAALAAGLTACGNTSPAAEAPKQTIKKSEPAKEINTDWAVGKAVSKADTGSSVLENNIEFYYLDDETNDSDSDIIQIRGLKDKTVEDKINAEIQAAYEDMNNWDRDHLPPVRGLTYMLENYNFDEPQYKNSYTSYGFNNADVLSIRITSYAGFPSYNSAEYYYTQSLSKSRCLNYDLNTGKQIKLADTVIDGLGLDYFNNVVKAQLAKSESLEEDSYGWGYDDIWFKQVGEFTGLDEDQQFWISGYDGNIELILDHRNPWVQSSDGIQYMTIPTDGVSAVAQRFNNGTSIFEDETEAYSLLDNNGFDPRDRVFDFGGDGNETIEGTPINMYYERSWYKSMPQEQIDILMGDENVLDQYKKEIVSVYNNYTESFRKKIYGSIELTGSASRMGKYTMISNGIYSSLYNSEQWQTLYNREHRNSYVFEGDSTVPLSFEDMFKEGTDVKQALIDGQVKGFYTPEDYVDAETAAKRMAVKEDVLREFLSELYDRGFGFNLSTRNFYMTYDEDVINSLIIHYLPEFENNLWAAQSGVYSVLYRDIGCDKLAIF